MSSIISASKRELSTALALLKDAKLPTQDIGENTQLYVIKEEYEIISTVAMEDDNTTALLRSLSTMPAKRGLGYCKKLVHYLEEIAKQKGLQSIYLLTTTAAEFFAKTGYQIVSRSEPPSFILQTSEYSSVCPASATVMKIELT